MNNNDVNNTNTNQSGVNQVPVNNGMVNPNMVQPNYNQNPVNNGMNNYHGNPSNRNNSNPAKKKMNTKTILIVVGVVIAVLFLLRLLGGGKSANGNSSKDYTEAANGPVQEVVNVKTFSDVDGEEYKQYIGKKITITGVNISEYKGEYSIGSIPVVITCDNLSSMNITRSGFVSVTGVVTSSTLYNSGIYMTSCSLEYED